MKPLQKLLTIGAAAALLALAAAPAAPAAAKKPKLAGAGAKVAREIAELERTANALSGEVAALAARTATLEGAPRPRTEVSTAGTPTPAPPAPAGGDFGGSFPDPTLLPETVGVDQLAEGSVDGSQVIDGTVIGAIAPKSILGYSVGRLSAEDFSTAVNARTLEDLTYLEGQRNVFELGRPDGQTLTLNTTCPNRIFTGGWKLGGSSYGIEVMASVPAFFANGQSPERDWTVVAREQLPEQEKRSTFGAQGLCLH
jgi:hypothetical protein